MKKLLVLLCLLALLGTLLCACEGETDPDASPSPLSNVNGITVTADGTLTWSPVQNATEYEVLIDSTDTVKIATCIFTELREGAHIYQVRAINAASSSD